ncbi:hypothetical protein PV328_011106 [Microctonus aethiopoides]|uniref:TNF family profile domain-containing protein n=1 Tax=Microctonus aethiopoides TaxID=144406 RepID=A0AA39C4C5_9HYME|nr:hypothetical protein PV328_011106 [Microctonus aethiopoides]
MKKQLVKDTLIQFDVTTGKPSSADEIIEYNVNMNVSLSNEKKSRIFQMTQSLVIIILTITFLIAYTQLKTEIQILEAQMELINSNLAILILKSEEHHGNLNRTNSHQQSVVEFQPYNTNNKMSFHYKLSSEANDDITLTAFSGDDAKLENNVNDRVIRSIITFEEHNETERTTLNYMNNDKKEDSTTWNDSRAGRIQRDVGRGPLVATFVGAVPEQHVTDTVYIGPWVRKNESRYGFNKFHLVEDKRSIEVTANGLFMISTQIYYFGEPTHYSYWILLNSEGSSTTKKVTKCASVSAVSATETSCYTSVILPLRRGDRLRIQQQERDRLINLREGYSYVQITLLSNDQQRRRTTSSIDRL